MYYYMFFHCNIHLFNALLCCILITSAPLSPVVYFPLQTILQIIRTIRLSVVSSPVNSVDDGSLLNIWCIPSLMQSNNFLTEITDAKKVIMNVTCQNLLNCDLRARTADSLILLSYQASKQQQEGSPEVQKISIA